VLKALLVTMNSIAVNSNNILALACKPFILHKYRIAGNYFNFKYMTLVMFIIIPFSLPFYLINLLLLFQNKKFL